MLQAPLLRRHGHILQMLYKFLELLTRQIVYDIASGIITRGRHYENDQFSLSIVYESCCAMCNALDMKTDILFAKPPDITILYNLHAILQSSFLRLSSHLKI